jgi:hypothetical protein
VKQKSLLLRLDQSNVSVSVGPPRPYRRLLGEGCPREMARATPLRANIGETLLVP